jgi:COP9 signalosome complex subunit 7
VGAHLTAHCLASFSVQTLPYEMLLTTLDIASVRALEDLLIEAVFLQAIRGKMDQRRGCFLVDEVLGRDLSDRALSDVGQQLTEWCVPYLAGRQPL